MAIKHLRTHYSMENPASVYDEEALTALELAGRTTGKVNECVDTINQHLVECDKEFEAQDKKIDGAKQYMVDNLETNVKSMFDKAVSEGLIDTITLDTYEMVTETLTNMNAGVFNVRTFGAVGNGGTDDTDAIQEAIEMARQEGTTVYLPAGNYLITRPLTIYSHTRLIGAGKRGINNVGYSGTQITGHNVDYVIRTDPNADTVFGTEIRDIRVNCTGTDHTATAIHFHHASECYLHNVTVNGNAKVGIHFEGTISHLDNLYLCANTIGLRLYNIHAVTVSNLNAWANSESGIEISGDCCGNDIRDSWIENCPYGVRFTQNAGSLLCYNTAIQNTSYTMGTTKGNHYFVWCYQHTENTFCVQGLRISDCVCKIADGVSAITLYSNDYTMRVTVENCLFLTNEEYLYAISHRGKFDQITLINNTCSSYSGTVFPLISEGDSTGNVWGNHFIVSAKSKYTEMESTYPVRMVPLKGSLQTMDEGQVYYKDGHLRFTDGNSSRIIPVQGEYVSTCTEDTIENVRQHLNGLIDILKTAKVIK